MSRQHKLIQDITPGYRTWIAKIIVAKKSMARISRYGATKYQRLILSNFIVSLHYSFAMLKASFIMKIIFSY